jgi:D-glycero-D-manno-heptose 1,7-bisphosphate phosphatase
MARLRSGVFLDRDGTLNVRPLEHDYVMSADEFSWLPGARQGIARLDEAGYVLFVVSNQQGVGLGVLKRSALHDIELRMIRDLAERGSTIRAFAYCVHVAESGCDCRKPEPGLILRLASDFDIDLNRSWMIGDSESDVIAGQAAGCRTALVGAQPLTTRPDIVAPSLLAAAVTIAGGAAVAGTRVTASVGRQKR